jgi:hypothetical protein
LNKELERDYLGTLGAWIDAFYEGNDEKCSELIVKLEKIKEKMHVK